MSFPSLVQIRDVIKIDHNVKRKSEWKKELRLFWDSLSFDVKCKNSNSCLTDPLSMLQEQEKLIRGNKYTVKMIQRTKRAGIEPINGAVLSWREMAQLMDPHNETTKGTHTHTQDLLPDQIRPSLVPLLKDFTELPLLGCHKPHQIVNSEIEPSFWCSHSLSLVKAEVVKERLWLATFYTIIMLVWCVVNQWLSLLRPKLHRSHFCIMLSRDPLSCHFIIFIMMIVLEEARGNLDIWPLEWMRNHKTHVIFQGQEYLFSFVSWNQAGIRCPRYISTTPVLFP